MNDKMLTIINKLSDGMMIHTFCLMCHENIGYSE